MILNAALSAFGASGFRNPEAITVEFDIEGRSWTHVSFRLSGFGGQVVLPEWLDSIAATHARRSADYAAAFLANRNGKKANPLVESDPDLGRADGLWRTTCFEVFAQLRDGSYAEFNISPSGQWAAYHFSSYREGGGDLDGHVQVIRSEQAGGAFELDAILHWPEWPHIDRIALSAVIEATDGSLSYWALAHPSDKPDFHHPDSFVLELS